MTEDDDWAQPHAVEPLDLAFPARGPELTPPWDDLPDEFRADWRGQSNPWTAFANAWFMGGWPTDRYLYPRADVDPDAAFAHLNVVMGTYGTKHEHKMAGAGYLLSRWFDRIEVVV